MAWKGMHVAAAGADVVMCASLPMEGDELGTKKLDKLDGQTFVARVGGDGVLKWVKPVDVAGDTTCEGVAFTSDGDAVVFGKRMDDIEHLYLERVAGDGTKRWLHEFSSVIAGDHPTITADQGGGVILAASFMRQIDLGDGPIGPDHGAMLMTVDREAKATGLLAIEGDAGQIRGVTDGANGIVIGFTADKPTTVGGVTVTPEKKEARPSFGSRSRYRRFEGDEPDVRATALNEGVVNVSSRRVVPSLIHASNLLSLQLLY